MVAQATVGTSTSFTYSSAVQVSPVEVTTETATMPHSFPDQFTVHWLPEALCDTSPATYHSHATTAMLASAVAVYVTFERLQATIRSGYSSGKSFLKSCTHSESKLPAMTMPHGEVCAVAV